jgi:spore coat polysaccharide biosynthesis protein SpsF
MKPRTAAIIQARMGSSRLPGKVMLGFGGQSMLTYLVERISRARSLDTILVATTSHERDNVIVQECETHGIPCCRGDEFDVLGRYVQAAGIAQADIIVRVTGDNPFTDPCSIDRAVDAIALGGADYAIETDLPVGTTGEALTHKALTFIDEVALIPRWREHVTLYAKEHPGAMSCALLAPPPECNRPDLSFTVDERADYEYARILADNFPNTDFELKNLVAIADEIAVRSFV